MVIPYGIFLRGCALKLFGLSHLPENNLKVDSHRHLKLAFIYTSRRLCTRHSVPDLCYINFTTTTGGYDELSQVSFNLILILTAQFYLEFQIIAKLQQN
jgi:hypothetical protein